VPTGILPFGRHRGGPCRDCGERRLGCHGSCERYAAWQRSWREEADRINTKLRAEKSINRYFVEGMGGELRHCKEKPRK